MAENDNKRFQGLELYHDVGVRGMFEELGFVFQRASFFLLANSFLVAAYVLIVTNKLQGSVSSALTLSHIAQAVAVVAIAIAILQGLTGWKSALRAKRWRKYVFDIEKAPEFPLYQKTIVKPPFMEVYGDLDPGSSSTSLLRSPLNWFERVLPPAPFSWLFFPIVFLTFWIYALVAWA